MILRRQGQYKAAQDVVKKINPEMTIIENMTYHQMCLMYSGQADAAEMLKADSGKSSDYIRQSVSDVLLYGIGNWHEYHRGDKQECREHYEKLLKAGSPFSFAFIAAESDYVRMFADKKR